MSISGTSEANNADHLSNSTPTAIDPDDAGAAGSATQASRADHGHAAVCGAPVSIVLTGTNAEGSGTGLARDTHQHAYNPPACRVYNNANISITTSGVAQALTFNSERYDTDSMHSTSADTGRITFNTAGLYHVFATIEFASNATGYRQAYLRVNGTTVIAASSCPAATSLGTELMLSCVWKFAAADYVEVFVAQLSGGALNVAGASAFSPEFGATWVGVG